MTLMAFGIASLAGSLTFQQKLTAVASKIERQTWETEAW